MEKAAENVDRVGLPSKGTNLTEPELSQEGTLKRGQCFALLDNLLPDKSSVVFDLKEGLDSESSSFLQNPNFHPNP